MLAMYQLKIIHLIFVLLLSSSGKAIGYALTQWPRLIRYTDHGMLEIDNNLVENLIRPLALGRKTICSPAHTTALNAQRSFTRLLRRRKNMV